MKRKKFASLLAFAFLFAFASFTAMATPVFDQPYMQAARADLNKARAALQRATSNKEGHRVKALEYTNKAIAEVTAGMRFDRRRNHAMPPGNSSLAGFDQPNMQAALNHLLDAQRNLNQASADKGGHRVKAMEFVGKAITEVNKGIAAGN